MFGWLIRLIFGEGAPYPQTNPWHIRGEVERVARDLPIWIVRTLDGSRSALLVEARWAFRNLSQPARAWRSAYWHDPFSDLWLYCYDGSTAFYIVLWDCLGLREAIPINLREAYSVLYYEYPDYLRHFPKPRTTERVEVWMPYGLPPGYSDEDRL